MNGTELISEERKRQIEKEGWSLEHDQLHNNEELPQAAECYLDHYLWGGPENLHYWPFDASWWKPDNSDTRLRVLVKAGALIAAEIDRITRNS